MHPIALLQAVLPLLAPSASLALFHPSPEPLAAAQQWLVSTHRAVGVRLTEPWLREYQVSTGCLGHVCPDQ